MAIKFEFYENPSAEEGKRKRYHARAVTVSTVSTEHIIHEIHNRTSLSAGDIQSALTSLGESLRRHLHDGERVHLEGIGYFQVTLACKEEMRDPKERNARNVHFKAVKFRADATLKGHLQDVEVERSKIRRHSAGLSEIEIDSMLTNYFRDNNILTRREFQELCQMTQITAIRHIKRLIAEKKIQNVNTARLPVYVPVPGQYRRPLTEQ